jgi:FtsZ-binding cell division protein ZapB
VITTVYMLLPWLGQAQPYYPRSEDDMMEITAARVALATALDNVGLSEPANQLLEIEALQDEVSVLRGEIASHKANINVLQTENEQLQIIVNNLQNGTT